MAKELPVETSFLTTVATHLAPIKVTLGAQRALHVQVAAKSSTKMVE